LTENSLLPRLQSAYRANHSTGTALLKVIGDVLLDVLTLDSGNLAMLSLLFLEKRPLTVKLSKFCSESFHRLTDRRVVFNCRAVWPTGNR